MNSAQEQSIIKQMKRMGQEIPDEIKNKPRLKTGEELFLWRAFWELDTERYPSQGGMTAIPVTRIFLYMQACFISESYSARFLYCIRQLDMHYVKSSNDELKRIRESQRKK